VCYGRSQMCRGIDVCRRFRADYDQIGLFFLGYPEDFLGSVPEFHPVGRGLDQFSFGRNYVMEPFRTAS